MSVDSCFRRLWHGVCMAVWPERVAARQVYCASVTCGLARQGRRFAYLQHGILLQICSTRSARSRVASYWDLWLGPAASTPSIIRGSLFLSRPAAMWTGGCVRGRGSASPRASSAFRPLCCEHLRPFGGFAASISNLSAASPRASLSLSAVRREHRSGFRRLRREYFQPCGGLATCDLKRGSLL